MEKIKVTINGKEITAKKGQTILDVVKEHKLDEIPTLCHDPKLPPFGSCYVCVVEVEGLKKLVPSCCNPVNDGMVIHTNNEKIKRARKTALELLLSNHYADCIAPCKNTCPAGVDIQGYIALINAGKYKEAVRLIKETNPLPVVCGRVCVRECEAACRRNKIDEPVGIDYLKRYAADIDLEDPWTPKLEKPNGKKVAIIGGGPAGLTCAYYLVKNGYKITLFEQLPHLGGMLRYGIPEYRLPKATLDKEIKWITDLGVEIKLNQSLGKDFKIEDLKKDGYDAIYLAMGAQKAKKMGIDDEDKIEGVLPGVDFLRDSQLEGKSDICGNVVVVGGGNTAIDAARTALRYKADKVTLLYRRTRKEMPAHEMEIVAAEEEGVEIIYLSAPTNIVQENGKIKALECINMELGKPDASGRRRPVPIEGSEYKLNCDFAISAIGQDVDLCGLGNGDGLKVTKWNSIDVQKNNFLTSIPGVFAGGDVVTGPAVAIDAIAHGKKAAAEIEDYIATGNVTNGRKEFFVRKDDFNEIPDIEFEGFEKSTREKMPELEPDERIKSFDEVELGFTEDQVKKESSRCLSCGCDSYFDCTLRKYATDFNIDLSNYLGEVRKFKVDHTHPFINLDPNKCISCGRCVRTCDQILKVSALGFVNRGFHSIMKPAMEKPLLDTNCISCGNCISACPTGAIEEKLPFFKPGPFVTDKKTTICNFCSVGCNLDMAVVNDDMYHVYSGVEDAHNNGYLCIKGRFAYRYSLDKNRILKPKIKKDGKLTDTNWEEAFSHAGDKIKEIIKKYGNDSVAIFASPKQTNEELYFLQKLARAGIKTNNITSFSHLLNGIELNSLDDMFGMTASTTTMDDLKKADTVVVINSELSEENLIMELKIKDAQKNGAEVVIVNSTQIKLNDFADMWIDSKKGTNTVLLSGVMTELIKRGKIDKDFIEKRCDDFEDFKKSIQHLDLDNTSKISDVDKQKLEKFIDLLEDKNKNVVVVYNIDSHSDKSANDIKAIGNFLMLTGRIAKEGNGLLLLRDFANSTGIFDMGVTPEYLPGYIKTSDIGAIVDLGKKWKTELKDIFVANDIKEKLYNEKIKAAIIIGEDPASIAISSKMLSGIEFIVLSDHCVTATAKEADLVLPLTNHYETEGTFTSCDKRVQKVNRIFKSKTGLCNIELISRLSKAIGTDITYKDSREIFDEIKEINPFYHNIDDDGFWGRKLFAKSFRTENMKGKFSIFHIDLSKVRTEKDIMLYSEAFFRNNVRNKLG